MVCHSAETPGATPTGAQALRREWTQDKGLHVHAQWQPGSTSGTITKFFPCGMVQERAFSWGIVARSELVDGKLHEKLSFEFPDGAKKEVTLVGGMKHGVEHVTQADGLTKTTHYEDGVLHGVGVCTLADGEKREMPFDNGRRHGVAKYVLPGGDVKLVPYQRGMKHGVSTCTLADGGRVVKVFEEGGELLAFRHGPGAQPLLPRESRKHHEMHKQARRFCERELTAAVSDVGDRLHIGAILELREHTELRDMPDDGVRKVTKYEALVKAARAAHDFDLECVRLPVERWWERREGRRHVFGPLSSAIDEVAGELTDALFCRLHKATLALYEIDGV
mgnify:FL=1